MDTWEGKAEEPPVRTIPGWDPDTCPQKGVIGVFGAYATGKTTLVQDMVSRMARNFDHVYVLRDGIIAPEMDNQTWKEKVPTAITWSDLDHAALQADRVLLVVDDNYIHIAGRSLEQFAKLCRYQDSMLLFTLSDPRLLSMKIRPTLVLTILFHVGQRDHRDCLYDRYNTVFETKEAFSEALTACTREHTAMVMFVDGVYWYKVSTTSCATA